MLIQTNPALPHKARNRREIGTSIISELISKGFIVGVLYRVMGFASCRTGLEGRLTWSRVRRKGDYRVCAIIFMPNLGVRVTRGFKVIG